MLGRKCTWITLVVLLLGVSVLPLATLQAQNPIVLSVAVPQFLEDFLTDDVFAQFEAANPGVQVNVVRDNNGLFVPNAALSGVDSYLDTLEAYASTADVLLVSTGLFTTAGTESGFFLNLAPLTSADLDLMIEDYYPAAWESFQWDGGVWALPLSVSPIVMVYSPDAFDNAGLAYPDEGWTLDDLTFAIRTLTEFDSDGAITTQAIQISGDALTILIRSLLERDLLDNSTIPNQPQLSGADLEALLTTWAQLSEEGYLDTPQNGNFTVVVGGPNENTIPMMIQENALAFDGGFNEANDSQAILLPGGHAGLSAQGFAISSGSQYPELAYALARFLTFTPQIANNFLSIRPARQSLAGTGTGGGPSQGRPGLGGGRNFTAEEEAMIDRALANALTPAQLRYTEYLTPALNTMLTTGVDARTALQETEVTALADLQAAVDRRSTTGVAVATPVPPVVLAPGEISLTFGMTSFITPLPNQAEWDQVIADFVAQTPQVGEVVLSTDMNMSFTELAENNDCFYLPYNAVPGGELDAVLNLDPFMDADPSFDRDDVLSGVLAQLQQNNRTWAMPIVLSPQVLRYDADLFAQAGVSAPANGWTVDEFVDALRALSFVVDEENGSVFASHSFGASHLHMLIAAFGGMPFDYRTDPVTVNFTNSGTVDAIRQVLDLAKEGLIAYEPLALTGGGVFIAIGGSSENADAIYTDTLDAFSQVLGRFAGQGGGGRITISAEGGGGGRNAQLPDFDPMTTFPSGTRYTPVAYDIATAFISSTTQNPEVCYAFINSLAQHPELFAGMPARRSLINNPAVVASQSPDVIAVYNQFDQMLQSPNAVTLPSTSGVGSTPTRFALENWLNQAFDRYVLEDADLEAELADAQVITQAFQQCINQLPPFDAAADDARAYFQQYAQCATQADPSLESLFGG